MTLEAIPASSSRPAISSTDFLENAIRAYSKDYAPNTDLSGIGADGFVNVSWEWAYNGNSDEKDTYLGDQAAANKASTVELSMKTTVTQID